MLTFFNKKQALSTMDTERYINAKEDLAAAGIKFSVKTQSASGSHNLSPKTGAHGFGRTKTHSGMLYDIYVHEKDYNRALYVINKR